MLKLEGSGNSLKQWLQPPLRPVGDCTLYVRRHYGALARAGDSGFSAGAIDVGLELGDAHQMAMTLHSRDVGEGAVGRAVSELHGRILPWAPNPAVGQPRSGSARAIDCEQWNFRASRGVLQGF